MLFQSWSRETWIWKQNLIWIFCLKDIKKIEDEIKAEDKITKENNDVISEKDAIDIIDNLTYNRL